MVLLEVLHRLSAARGWRLTVAHFNHQLRGRNSDADERLVRRAAESRGLPFGAGRGDVRGCAREGRISLEMAGRKLRHGFLAGLARERGIRTVALAHHGDDQVELFFLRLLRGAGGAGLAGMRWESPSPSDGKIMLARPLLGLGKATLKAWAGAEGITFREDATNAQLDAPRNRVRHELAPLLAGKYQPALREVLSRQMEILGAEAEFVSEAARTWLRRARRRTFERLPVAVQRRCVQLQLAEQGWTATFDLVEALRGRTDRGISLSGTLQAKRAPDGRVQVGRPDRPGFNPRFLELRLEGRSGRMEFDGVKIKWRTERLASGIVRAPKEGMQCEYLDADKVGSRLVVRHWRAGDRFQPIGMASPVKLQDLFTNKKIPRSRRRELLVGERAGRGLFWVEGLRVAERFKLEETTVRRLKWGWQRL